MNESSPFIDCNICLMILQYLNERSNADLRELDGYMRTKGTTTAVYHVEKHLKPNDFISISEAGTIKKKEIFKNHR